MSFSCPDRSFDDLLALAKRFGYSGIEPRAGSGHAHGAELTASAAERTALREKAAAHGVALCCLAISCRYADPATTGAQVEETHRYIDLAADIGSPRLRVFGGKIPDGVSREQAIDGVATALSALADHAAERGITICLETHDDWCDPAHVATVMALVDSPAVAVNWDVLHPLRTSGYTLDRAYEILRPWIRHIHIHDASLSKDSLEFRAIGAGGVDHKRVLELLQAYGYNGYLSGEWINWEPCEVHLQREIETLRSYEASLGIG